MHFKYVLKVKVQNGIFLGGMLKFQICWGYA